MLDVSPDQLTEAVIIMDDGRLVLLVCQNAAHELTSLNVRNSTVRWVPTERRSNRGTAKLSHLPKVTQLVSGRARIGDQGVCLQSYWSFLLVTTAELGPRSRCPTKHCL